MPRIAPLAKDQQGLVVRAVMREARRRFGKAPDSMTTAARSKATFLGSIAYEVALDKAGKVDHRRKELAVLKTAMVVGCEFCCDIGSFLARSSGVTEDELRDLMTYRESPRFDAADVAVIDLAVAMSATPTAVDDALVARLREHLDEDQVVELSAAIAWENYRARLNHTLDLEPGGFSDGAFCVRPERDDAGVVAVSSPG